MTFNDFSADINKKLETIKPDAFFVFNKQPLVLFFDLTSENIGKKNESEIHKLVWSFDNFSVIFLINRSNGILLDTQENDYGRLFGSLIIIQVIFRKKQIL